MNQLEYLPGIAGQSVQLDGPSAFVGIAEEMRSREWDYDLGYRDLVTATRPARTVDVTFHADYDTADTLRRVADADVMARTPGTFVAQKEWKQRGYILASDVNDIHYGRLSTELKIALLDGAWWRLVKRSFIFEEPVTTYDSATGETVSTAGAADAPLHALTVYGKSVQDGTPTPDAPVPIEVVEGRNLCDIGKTNSRTSYSVEWTYADKHAHVSTNGASSTNNSFSYSSTFNQGYSMWLEPGTYTLSYDAPSGITMAIQARNADGTVPEKTYSSGYQSSPYTFTLTDANFYAVQMRLASGSNVDADIFIMVEEESTASPYVPYGCIGVRVGDSATPIDLNGNILASLPDGTHDELNIDSAGNVVLTKRVGNVTLAVADMDNGESYPGWKNSGIRAIIGGGVQTTFSNQEVMGNIWPPSEQSYIFGVNTVSNTSDVVFLSVSRYGLTQSQWIANYPNLVCEFYVKYATPQTIDLGYITMPTVSNDSQVSIVAAVAPTITAEWQTSPDVYLDYPHDYEYDYQKTSYTGGITPSVFTPSEPYLVMYGPAVNPYVIVGGNRYQVNVTVPSGGYLVVDGREKTITLTLADGTVQNVFSSGVRGGGAGGGTYIFEKIPAGTSEVTFDGSFGFDIGWYEEEGEPPWSLS